MLPGSGGGWEKKANGSDLSYWYPPYFEITWYL